LGREYAFQNAPEDASVRCCLAALEWEFEMTEVPRIRPAKFVRVVYRTYRFDETIRWYLPVAPLRHPVVA